MTWLTITSSNGDEASAHGLPAARLAARTLWADAEGGVVVRILNGAEELDRLLPDGTWLWLRPDDSRVSENPSREE